MAAARPGRLSARAWLDVAYLAWLEEARARRALELAWASYAAAAASAGARRSDIPDLTDPADELDDIGARQDRGSRSAQITAFITATGGEEG